MVGATAFVGLGCGVETVLWKALLNVFAGEPTEKVLCGSLLFGVLKDDGALANFWVAADGEANEAAERAVVGGAGDGERDEADLGVAGFSELRGLRDIFRDDELASELFGEVKACESFGCGKTVRRVQRVGDGDPFDFRAGEDIECEGLRGRIVARPEDEDAARVGCGSGFASEACGDDLLGMCGVGGEEDVLRIAVDELLGEGCRGAEGGDDLDAGGSLVRGSKRG